MRILVCVKQVPDTEGPVAIAADGLTVAGSGWRLNSFDEFAVEEALRIKAAFPGTIVEAITVGPGRASDVLRRALSLGADGGIHLLREGKGDPLPSEVAALIAAVVRGRGYDLVLTGAMAEDDTFSQTGPMLAEKLAIPCATAVMAETLSPDIKTIRVERELEGGLREALEMPLPALIAVQSGINRPRYPALSHVLRSRRQPLETIPVDALPAAPRRERVIGLAVPEPSGRALFLEGTAREKAAQLAAILQEKSLL